MSLFDSIFGGGGSVEVPDPSEYLPLIRAQADINRVNQNTPFGQTNYTYENTPLDFDTWSAQNPVTSGGGGRWQWQGGKTGDNVWVENPATTSAGTQEGYQSYLDAFDPGQASVETSFSPAIQNLFTQQFSPDNYQKYSDDYMANARRLLDPVYDRQTETFQQTMANRGQPVGGELYDDTYGNLMDAQNRGWESAAFEATRAGENARLQDWNRLMSAMGGSTVPVQPIDTMGPANMAMNANIANLQNQNNASSNLWNTAAGLGGAYIMAKNPAKSFWGG